MKYSDRVQFSDWVHTWTGCSVLGFGGILGLDEILGLSAILGLGAYSGWVHARTGWLLGLGAILGLGVYADWVQYKDLKQYSA
ncbi:hypothetical protein DPMN_058092 [Dreissena polymorpha]|uniref:Uncharacterized protein n=1 Tax=Dreissena polymorpha TaxID=45954 RepID=A0A9D4HF46_DREPO|nr:hypothetical protein DPMN_058092 [Dreissena polymorpha]